MRKFMLSISKKERLPKVKVFTLPHYLHNFVQSTFNALSADKVREATLVVSGDGGYYSKDVIQVLSCHLAHPMAHINLDCIRLVIQCLEFPFHLITVVISHMLFLLVVLYTNLLALSLMFLSQEVGVLVLGMAVLALP